MSNAADTQRKAIHRRKTVDRVLNTQATWMGEKHEWYPPRVTVFSHRD